ncbi:MAG: hypothetical protein ACTHML_15860 [Ginsengibacter sp.]
MSKLLLISILLFCLSLDSSFGQTKSVPAVKITAPIRIDGDADDESWEHVPVISGFITSTPVFGEKASHTEVKIAYDNSAVYVLAYLFDDPKNIKRRLTARDDIEE